MLVFLTTQDGRPIRRSAFYLKVPTALGKLKTLLDHLESTISYNVIESKIQTLLLKLELPKIELRCQKLQLQQSFRFTALDDFLSLLL